MTRRRKLRAILSLLAAYMVALHPMLLAAAVPEVGGADPFEPPICVTVHPVDHAPATPAGHDHDCLAACVAAGCGAGLPMLDVASAVPAGWGHGRAIALVLEDSPAPPSGIARAYCSRAPPPR
jgi:hypothetical protein